MRIIQAYSLRSVQLGSPNILLGHDINTKEIVFTQEMALIEEVLKASERGEYVSVERKPILFVSGTLNYYTLVPPDDEVMGRALTNLKVARDIESALKFSEEGKPFVLQADDNSVTVVKGIRLIPHRKKKEKDLRESALAQ